jgi:hypothetical protein
MLVGHTLSHSGIAFPLAFQPPASAICHQPTKQATRYGWKYAGFA